MNRAKTSLQQGHQRSDNKRGFFKGISPQGPATPYSKDTTLNFTSTTFGTSPKPLPILAASTLRRYLLIQNVGDVTVFLGFGVKASINGNNSVELPAGSVFSLDAGIVPNNEINAVSATAGRVSVIDGSVEQT